MVSRKLSDPIIDSDFIKIIKECKYMRHKVAYSIMYLAGLRISEVLALQPENIKWERKLIQVVQGKGSKDRYVPIAKPLRRYLKWLPIPIKKRAIQMHLAKTSLASIGRKIHPHLLRHSCACNLISKKWPINYVKDFLGHANISSTQVYLHTNPDQLIEMMNEAYKQ